MVLFDAVPSTAFAMLIFVQVNVNGVPGTLTLEVESTDTIDSKKGKIQEKMGFRQTSSGSASTVCFSKKERHYRITTFRRNRR